MKTVTAYTDGSCSKGGKVGGWGAVLECNGHRLAVKEAAVNTTNNRMELEAVINVLELLDEPCKVKINSDSRYVIDGATQWLPGWKRRNWRNSKQEPVNNRDLWERLDVQLKEHKTEFAWVKGHQNYKSNDPRAIRNNLVDHLAATASV